MGTDIHMHLEHRVDGKWKHVPVTEKPGWMSSAEWLPSGRYRYSADEPWNLAEWDLGRNYSLFAMLADVRNGSGFAGCDLGDGFEIIAEPRGWPTDLSPELEAEVEAIQHTPSWLSLKEVLDWFEKHGDDLSTIRGVVNGWEAAKLKPGEKPGRSSGAVWGGNILTINRHQFEQIRRHVQRTDEPKDVFAGEAAFLVPKVLIPESWISKRREYSFAHFESPAAQQARRQRAAKVAAEPFYKIFVTVEWQQTYRQCAGEFWFETLDKWKALDDDPANVRLVFHFDS